MQNYKYLSMINETVYNNKLKIKSIEKGAHCEEWYSEFNSYYRVFPDIKPYVQRLNLSINGNTFGFIHCRPKVETSEICTAYLPPPKQWKDKKYYPTCKLDFSAYENDICCVPYIMPEFFCSSCAPASIWIVLQILKNRYSNIKTLTMPEMQEIATGSPAHHLGQGFEARQIIRVLNASQCRCFFRKYTSDFESFINLYSYIESGIPAIIGVHASSLPWWKNKIAPEEKNDYHALVIIGHTLDDEGEVDNFIVHDVSTFPYQIISRKTLFNAWKVEKEVTSNSREVFFTVPIEINVPFDNAVTLLNEIQPLLDFYGLDQFRSFLIGRGNIRSNANLKDQNSTFIDFIQKVKFPRYSWQFSLYKSGKQAINGECEGYIWIDAMEQPKIIAIDLPSFRAWQDEKGAFNIQEVERKGPIKEIYSRELIKYY